MKRYYYCDKKFLLTNAHVVNFISNNSYRLNPYIIELSKSVLLDIDISNRGAIILNLDGLNMLIARSQINSCRYKYQGWLYSYNNPFIQNEFYLK